MVDQDVLAHINQLVDEEHKLLRAAEHDGGLDEAGRARLQTVQVSLDQCWDLLRQRRARREFGQDAEQVHVRSAATVEGFVG